MNQIFIKIILPPLNLHTVALYVALRNFSRTFQDNPNTEGMQNRHNNYNYEIIPAVKKYLESVTLKPIIFNPTSHRVSDSVAPTGGPQRPPMLFIVKENFYLQTFPHVVYR